MRSSGFAMERMNHMTIIDSSSLISIDNHFKVSAGPGAGKTFWLTNHIKNVLKNSKRLGKTGKIACITYTNTAVEEIQTSLRGASGNRIFIGTIHSFLYANIVKPYSFLIKDNQGDNLLNLKKLDGHDEHMPNRSFIRSWIGNVREGKYRYLEYYDKNSDFINYLKKYDWILDDNKEIQIGLRQQDRWFQIENKFPLFDNKEMIDYKKRYWNIGQLHHEDVLYFSYRILTEHPKVINYLSAKYPYLFIDEFQDTNPIQTEIVQMLARKKTLVGVIGDSLQSIYGFQGAKRMDFENFTLPNIESLTILNNRRSTNNIVKFLNEFHGGSIEQEGIREVEGSKIILLIGDKLKAIEHVRGIDCQAAILARRNETVSQLINCSNDDLSGLWDELRAFDSNSERQNFLYSTIIAVELLKEQNYIDSLRIISNLIKPKNNNVKFTRKQKRFYSIQLLEYLQRHWKTLQKKNLVEYNNEMRTYIDDNFNISKPTASITKRGKVHDLASTISVTDCVQALRLHNEKRLIKTIHKAKGAEYDSVLVVMEKEDLKYLYQPKINSAMDHTRVFYVGFSRARDNLYINIPELDEAAFPLTQKCNKIYV